MKIKYMSRLQPFILIGLAFVFFNFVKSDEAKSGATPALSETNKHFLEEQARDADWFKIAVMPERWLLKEIEIEGWLSIRFNSAGEMAETTLFDNPDSLRMNLRRRCLEINHDDLKDAIEKAGAQGRNAAIVLNGKCIFIRGTFAATGEYFLGGIKDVIEIKLLPGQPFVGPRIDLPDKLIK